MAANETTIELVKFTSGGADEVAAAAKHIAEESSKAAEAHAAFAKIVSDPAFRRAAESLEATRRATATLQTLESKRLDLAVRSRALRTGAYAEEVRGLQNVAREAAKVQQLERSHQLRARHEAVKSGAYAAGLKPQFANDAAQRKAERLEERARLAQQREHVRGGGYGREYADRLKLDRERQDVERLQRRAELTARHGRLGGAVAAFGESGAGRAMHYGATAVAAAGGGMVRQGFGGTVESGRLALETKLAARELAGAFRPAITLATRATKGFREWMERRSEGQQNAIGLAGAGLMGHLALRAATGKGLVGWGSAAVNALGSFGGQVAGNAVAKAGGNAAGSAAGSAAGATAAGVGAKLGLIGGTLIGIPLAVAAEEAMGDNSYYDMLRGKGNNKLVSGLGAFGGSAMQFASRLSPFDTPTFSDALRKKGDLGPGSPGQRRQVTKADAGFDEIGSSYDRLSAALSMTDTSTGNGPDATLLGVKVTDLLGDIKTALVKMEQNGSTPQFRRGE